MTMPFMRTATSVVLTLGALATGLQPAFASEDFTRLNSNAGVALSTNPDRTLINVARCFVMADPSVDWRCNKVSTDLVECDTTSKNVVWQFLDHWSVDSRSGATIAAINVIVDGQPDSFALALYGGDRSTDSYVDYHLQQMPAASCFANLGTDVPPFLHLY